MRETYLTIQSHTTRVCHWGESHLPTLLCLHGLGSTCLSFIELAEQIKDTFHVIAIDLPGHGKSSSFASEEDYGMPCVVHHLSLLTKKLHLDSFVLLAHSYGGCVALHYCNQYPAKVRKLFLLDGGYHDKQLRDAYLARSDVKKHSNQIGSLEEEISYYEKDFSQYRFSTMGEHLQLEKSNHQRWSNLLEVAAMDLMKQDKEEVIWHASADTARGIIKALYQYPIKELGNSSVIPMVLFLAKQTNNQELTHFLLDHFLQQYEQTQVISIDAGHLIHWDQPEQITEHIRQLARGNYI